MKDLQKEFLLASQTKDIEKINDLIEKGIDINFQDENGQTALHHAVIKKKLELVILLIEKGANSEIKDNYHQPALHYAYQEGESKPWSFVVIELKKGYKEIKKVLAHSGGPDLSIINRDSFFNAVKSGELDEVKEFIEEMGVFDVNMRIFDGSSALHIAAQFGHTKIAKTLLEFEISFSNRDQTKHWEYPKAEVNAVNNDLRTPLHVAVENEQSKMVELLISNGADPNFKDKNGQTPLDLAKSDLQKIIKTALEQKQEEPGSPTSEKISIADDPEGWFVNTIITALIDELNDNPSITQLENIVIGFNELNCQLIFVNNPNIKECQEKDLPEIIQPYSNWLAGNEINDLIFNENILSDIYSILNLSDWYTNMTCTTKLMYKICARLETKADFKDKIKLGHNFKALYIDLSDPLVDFELREIARQELNTPLRDYLIKLEDRNLKY